ncbi:hypothetical protein ABIC78_003798 [Novosphingobium sp. 1529]|uniref:lasso peptide biosynthesis B2 protein n=1 Tax=Novosphingobium sp. 1529 TaxID=3156424 RepID=UPI00339648F4
MARPEIAWCQVGARVVVIDIARDTYLHLSPPLVEALHVLRSGSAHGDGPADRFERLARIGLCDADFSRPVAPTILGVPERDLPPRGINARRRAPWAMGTALARIVIARLAVRMIPLRVLVAWIRRLQARPSPYRPPDSEAIQTALFVRARQLIPAQGTCLPDSIALLHFLRARGIACRMVLGVRLDPFEAHCWVQSADAILGDTHERVACFTPILQL